jgi:ABC-type bacteriocin/lantibiotic exporter with double-glycine peptidase domain
MLTTTSTSLPIVGIPPILDFLVQQLGLEPDRGLLQQTLRRLRAEPLSATQLLVAGASDAGVRLTSVRLRIADAVRQVHPECPWLALRSTPSGELEALFVIEGKNGKARCVDPARSKHAVWRSEKDLATWLGHASAEEEAEWLVPEPAAPLAALRSSDPDAPMPPWPRLKALLAGERSTLWVAVIYSVVIGLLSLVVPVAVQSLVNTIAFGSVLQPLVVLTLFVFVALGFSALINSLRAWVVEILQRSIFSRVGTDVTWRLLRVRADAFDKYHGPELVNRFFDVVTVQKAAATLLIDGLGILMQTGIGLLLVALYHPLLLAFDIFLVASMLFIVLILGRGAVYTSIKESKAKYAFQAWLEEIATHLVTFKSAGGTELAAAKAEGLLEEYLHYRQKHFKILLRQIAGSFLLQAIASSLLLGIGGWLVIERQLTLGQLVASELIVTLMVSGFTKFGKHLEVFYDLQAAVDKLGALVDLPLERAGGEASLPGSGPASVRMTGLSLGYKPDAPVLNVTDWQIRAGERIGLVGHHGCGKSTMADTLFGLRQAQSGSLLLDGVDYRALPLSTIRSQVALVRGIELFTGTILENVRLGRESMTISEVVNALRQAGVLEEIQGLPDGLETVLHPGGRPLSASQASRLMIARAIAANPRLLILDYALDPVDRAREREPICDMLFHPNAPWTVLCITERPDLLALCDRVMLLENGDVKEVQR